MRGSLKLSETLYPPSKIVAAMPVDATTSSLIPPDRTFKSNKVFKNVWSLPPDASKRNIFPSFSSIDDVICHKKFVVQDSNDTHSRQTLIIANCPGLALVNFQY